METVQQPQGSGVFDAKDMADIGKLVPEGEEPNVPLDSPVLPAATPAQEPTALAPPPAPTPAPVPAPALDGAAPAATPAPTPAPQGAGDLRQALRASRMNEKRMRDEADQLRKQLEAAKAGKPIPEEGGGEDTISDEELADLEENYPLQAKMVRQNRELKARVEQLAPASRTADAQPGFTPPTYEPGVQMVIDQVPALIAWQYDPQAQAKFQRAVEYDTALFHDPDWKSKPDVERMAEAARRAAAAFSAAAPSDTRQDPAAVIASAQVEGPKGLSDFRGSGPANAPQVNYRAMSDEQILSSLPVID